MGKVEARGYGTQEIAIPAGEELAHEHEGDRGEAGRVSDHEESESNQRQQLEATVRVDGLQVEEDRYSSQRDAHEHARDGEQETSSSLVHEEDRSWSYQESISVNMCVRCTRCPCLAFLGSVHSSLKVHTYEGW